MKILALDFSSEQRSAAVVERREGGPAVVLAGAAELGGRGALELVEQALVKAGCEREEVDCLAVCLGPGSYTGIRGAISLAQGWHLGLGTRLLGVSSVECMAAQAEALAWTGAVNIVVDAQRNEFYLARYRMEAGRRTELEPLRLATLAEMKDLAGRGEIVAGPSLQRWFPEARNLFPDAGFLGRLAAERRDDAAAESLQPIYLRETSFTKLKIKNEK